MIGCLKRDIIGPSPNPLLIVVSLYQLPKLAVFNKAIVLHVSQLKWAFVVADVVEVFQGCAQKYNRDEYDL